MKKTNSYNKWLMALSGTFGVLGIITSTVAAIASADLFQIDQSTWGVYAVYIMSGVSTILIFALALNARIFRISKRKSFNLGVNLLIGIFLILSFDSIYSVAENLLREISNSNYVVVFDKYGQFLRYSYILPLGLGYIAAFFRPTWLKNN